MDQPKKLTPEKQAYRWLMNQTSPARQWLSFAIVAGFLNGVLLLVQAGLLAHIIHQLVMAAVPREQLIACFIGSVLVVVARGCCAWAREYCGFKAGAEVRLTVRKAVLDKLERLGPMAIAQQPAGSWTTVVVEQVEELQEFMAKYLPQMMLAVLVPLVMLVVVFPENWAVGVIFLGTAPLIPLFMALVGIKAAEANRRNFKALERLGGFFLDRLQGMETLRLFCRTGAAQAELTQASDYFRQKTMEVLRLAFLSSTVLEFFAAVSIALTAVYLGMSFLGYLEFGSYGQDVTLYTALFLLLLAPEFYQPLRELGTYYHAKAKAVGAAESILEVISQKEPEVHQGKQSFKEQGSVSINARGLTVMTPRGRQPLLRDVTFTIPAGCRVGIVGPSGAGKTTLINALMGFYGIEGELRLNNQLLSTLDLESWRDCLAWLGQHPLIIAGTVLENIAFGRNITREQALEALKRAQGMDILDKLPDWLDSPLQEHGGNLSVGQAQRIALARALAQPVNVLILDEPTASIDADSEQKVLQALAEIPAQTTVITVTHRISQIMAMDHVLMIDDGQLVASGHPKTLMQQEGSFKQFIQCQYRSVENA